MSNNGNGENNKRVLPNRKNRGAKMIALEEDMDKMLYDEKHQWLFLEESSDDDFDPNEKCHYDDESDVNQKEDIDDQDDDDSSSIEDYDNDNDSNYEDEDNIKKINSKDNNINDKRSTNTNCFLLKRKRGGDQLSNEEICNIDQINIEKIDNYEMKRAKKSRNQTKKMLVNGNSNKVNTNLINNKPALTTTISNGIQTKALFMTSTATSSRDLPVKKVLFKIQSLNKDT